MDWNNSEIYLGKAKKCLNFRATASWILSMMNYEENKNVEEFLTNKGHNLSNCEWMVHEDNEIIKEKDE